MKFKALPSNISLASGHVLTIPLCDNASAAAGGTAFGKDPDRSETKSLQQPREVRQAEDKQLSVQPCTGSTHPEWMLPPTWALKEIVPAKPVLFGFSA